MGAELELGGPRERADAELELGGPRERTDAELEGLGEPKKIPFRSAGGSICAPGGCDAAATVAP
jgi:hypothetical protein